MPLPDDPSNLPQAQEYLRKFLDAIREEAVDADWDISEAQVVELHGALSATMETWMRRHGRWGG